MKNLVPELRNIINQLTHYDTQGADPRHSRELFDSIRGQAEEWKAQFQSHKADYVREFGKDDARRTEDSFRVLEHQLQKKYNLLDNLPRKP